MPLLLIFLQQTFNLASSVLSHVCPIPPVLRPASQDAVPFLSSDSAKSCKPSQPSSACCLPHIIRPYPIQPIPSFQAEFSTKKGTVVGKSRVACPILALMRLTNLQPLKCSLKGGNNNCRSCRMAKHLNYPKSREECRRKIDNSEKYWPGTS